VSKPARAALSAQGITLRLSDTEEVRSLAGKVLTLSTRTSGPTQRFQLLHQVALLTQRDLIEATLDLARFQSEAARSIAKIGLANYFAGAAMLPYRAFLAAAQETRHDLERLADRFGASIEQVAHRLSTLQRPGMKGIPFFFVRVDQAGTIIGHPAAICPFRRRLPVMDRARSRRHPRPHPCPACGNARWGALCLDGQGFGQAIRQL